MPNRNHSIYSNRQRVLVLTFTDPESAARFDEFSNEEIYDAVYEALEWLCEGLEQYA